MPATFARADTLSPAVRRRAFARLVLGLAQMAGATAAAVLLAVTGISASTLAAVVGTTALTIASVLLFGSGRAR